MGNDTMDLNQLASFLGRDARELGKLALRGNLPGRKIAGEWRFAPAEIHHWLEQEMPLFSDRDLRALDPACPTLGVTPVLSSLLPVECIDLALPARTRKSVLRELVGIGDRAGRIWDPSTILSAVEAREEMGSTAQPDGYAVPHPRRRLENTLSDSFIALGRTSSGIPFGEKSGGLTDLFFLVCSTNDCEHVRILARLARVLRTPGFLNQLREVDMPQEAWGLIDSVENSLTN